MLEQVVQHSIRGERSSTVPVVARLVGPAIPDGPEPVPEVAGLDFFQLDGIVEPDELDVAVGLADKLSRKAWRYLLGSSVPSFSSKIRRATGSTVRIETKYTDRDSSEQGDGLWGCWA